VGWWVQFGWRDTDDGLDTAVEWFWNKVILILGNDCVVNCKSCNRHKIGFVFYSARFRIRVCWEETKKSLALGEEICI